MIVLRLYSFIRHDKNLMHLDKLNPSDKFVTKQSESSSLLACIGVHMFINNIFCIILPLNFTSREKSHHEKP